MPKIYNAPKPKYSSWEWFKFIVIRIVFPPILLWDLMKLGANKLLGEWVGGFVLPAQNYNFDYFEVTDDTVSDDDDDDDDENDLTCEKHEVITHDENDLTCEKHEVITHDEAHLDTFEIKHAAQTNIDPKYQTYIINLVGNGTFYEQIIPDMKDDARALQVNVVGFNLRGVGQSTGKAKSSLDLVVDGIAQVQRLLDQNVSPQNITLKGHSLGAGVASLVAQHFHQLGQPINLFNSRSFSTITNFLVGHIRLQRDDFNRALGHKDSVRGIIFGWLAKPSIKFGVALAKWEIDAGSAFKSIPEAYRDYIVVRSRKEIRGERIDDAVIPHYASIHKELISERRAKKAKIDKEIENLDEIIQKGDLLAKPGLVKARESLAQARETIKSDRKMETDLHEADGHNSSWSSLKNRSGKSAQAFFRDFVQRTEEDHAVKSAPDINLSV